MKIINVTQGSPEWLAHRMDARNASEAPVVLGQSSKISRNALIEAKATGIERDIPDFVREVIFANGHKVEGMAGPMAEEIIGDELFPVVAISDDGYLSASYDGLTMGEETGWECKQWNEDKAQMVREGVLPPEDAGQVWQQLAVGAKRVLYMITDGTPEQCVHMMVEATGEEDKKLRAAWAQFDEDKANYQPREKAPQVTGTATEDLPAVSVQVSGDLSIVDNFDRFESALKHFIDEVLVREPKTDQDFADLEQQIKTLKKAEDALDAAENQLLAQVEAVDTAKKRKEMLHKLARDNRLTKEKLVKAKKQTIKLEIARDADKAVGEHERKVEATLDGYALPRTNTDFNAAMKGKRTITTLQDAADNEVARAKIAINEAADLIRANAKTIADAGYEFLFADRQQLALKDSELVKLEVANRINNHKREEERRLEAERQRIASEEKAKAERQAQQKADAEKTAQQANETPKPEPVPQVKSESPATYEAPESSAPSRPSDYEILRAIAAEFQVDTRTAAAWVLEMNQQELQRVA